MIAQEKRIIEVYVELLEEGTVTFRSTNLELLSDGIGILLPTPDYNPEDEIWAFLPGETVRCTHKKTNDGEDVLLVTGFAGPIEKVRVYFVTGQGNNQVFHATQAMNLGDHLYKLLPPEHHVPETAPLPFSPGTIVRVRQIRTPGGEKIMAVDGQYEST